jgi:hypothetical protein
MAVTEVIVGSTLYRQGHTTAYAILSFQIMIAGFGESKADDSAWPMAPDRTILDMTVYVLRFSSTGLSTPRPIRTNYEFALAA